MTMPLNSMPTLDTSMHRSRVSLRRWLGACALLLMACGLLPARSWATCTTTPISPIVLTFSYGALTVDPNAHMGDVIGKMTGTLGSTGGGNINCTSSIISTHYVGDGAYTVMNTTTGAYPSIGLAPVYSTAVPGVGLAFTYTGSLAVASDISGAGMFFPAHSTVGLGASTYVNGGAGFVMYLVKTGPIQGGTLTGEFAHWDAQESSGTTSNIVSMQFVGSIPVVPSSPSCTVTSPSISVPLDPTSVAGFAGVGTTAGNAQNFNITLNCSAGTAGTSTHVSITLTDATNTSNTTDMLTPSAGSTAAGVGIRIFNGSTPVRFGPDSNAIGNTNQWSVTTVGAGGGSISIPLSAQYVQIGSTVGGGDVKALATFTMAYN